MSVGDTLKIAFDAYQISLFQREPRQDSSSPASIQFQNNLPLGGVVHHWSAEESDLTGDGNFAAAENGTVQEQKIGNEDLR